MTAMQEQLLALGFRPTWQARNELVGNPYASKITLSCTLKTLQRCGVTSTNKPIPVVKRPRQTDNSPGVSLSVV